MNQLFETDLKQSTPGGMAEKFLFMWIKHNNLKEAFLKCTSPADVRRFILDELKIGLFESEKEGFLKGLDKTNFVAVYRVLVNARGYCNLTDRTYCFVS
jgi:hypothetical protein